MEKEAFSSGRWNNFREMEEKIKTSCKRVCFAEGKRDDISHQWLQVGEEEEAREGEGAFSQALGCLDVKDAFLQVPQDKPVKVKLRREEFVV